MHVTPHQRTVVNAPDHFQIRTVHVDGIIHHPLIQSVSGNNLSLASRKMSRIRLRRKIARIVFPFQANVESVERNVLA